MIRFLFITIRNNKYNEIVNYLPELEQDFNCVILEIQSLNIKDIIKVKLLTTKENVSCSSFVIIYEDIEFYLKALNNLPEQLIILLLNTIGNKGIYEICKMMKNYESKVDNVLCLYNFRTDKRIIYLLLRKSFPF